MTSIAALSFLPVNYGYTALAGASTFLLHIYQIRAVSRMRKEAKIPYPQLYAEKSQMEANPAAFTYNCVQRAHANTLELMPQMLFGAAIAGLQFPIAAGACMGTWVLGRYLFTLGYLTGVPSSRNTKYGGGIHYLGAIGIMGLSFWSAGSMIYATLV